MSEKSATRVLVAGKRLRSGDVLMIDGGEVVYVDGMTVGDYFAEAIFVKYKPQTRGRSIKTDNRPYYRKLEKKHKSN